MYILPGVVGDLGRGDHSMAGRERFEVTQSKLRSAVANGSRVMNGIDARSASARRYRDISNAIASDLGGTDHLTEAQLQLIRSATGLVLLRERLDTRALNGQRIDAAEYCRIANSLRRVLATIGLRRVAKNVTPDLGDYIAGRTRRRAAEQDADELEDAE